MRPGRPVTGWRSGSAAAGSPPTCPAWPRRAKDRWRGPVSRPANGWSERLGRPDGTVSAPMQGTVMRVEVTDGEEVAAGQVIAVVEAMKMENPLRAPHAGRVTGLQVAAGDTVAQGATVCQVTEVT